MFSSVPRSQRDGLIEMMRFDHVSFFSCKSLERISLWAGGEDLFLFLKRMVRFTTCDFSCDFLLCKQLLSSLPRPEKFMHGCCLKKTVPPPNLSYKPSIFFRLLGDGQYHCASYSKDCTTLLWWQWRRLGSTFNAARNCSSST